MKIREIAFVYAEFIIFLRSNSFRSSIVCSSIPLLFSHSYEWVSLRTFFRTYRWHITMFVIDIVTFEKFDIYFVIARMVYFWDWAAVEKFLWARNVRKLDRLSRRLISAIVTIDRN